MSQPFGHLLSMTRAEAVIGPTKNLLLRMLSSLDLSALLSHAAEINLQPGAVLRTEEASLDYVYFPTSGIVSLDIVLQNQQPVETALIGYNGAVGLLAGIGIDHLPGRVVVQTPGRATRISRARFMEVADRNPAVRDMIGRGLALLLGEIQQNVCCCVLHDVQSRLCRWLVCSHDFCYGEAIPLTQDFLAKMLAVRRTTITLAAGALQDSGIIQYHRGVIQVLDRGALEALACECHSIVARRAARIMAVAPERTSAAGSDKPG